MVGVRGQHLNRSGIAAQFVRDDDPRLTKLGYQSFGKALCRFGIPPRLYKNITNFSPRVDRAPQSVLLATDRDHDFVHVPLVVRSRPIPTDAISNVSTKTIDPEPDCFPADTHTPRSQQVFNISCAQG